MIKKYKLKNLGSEKKKFKIDYEKELNPAQLKAVKMTEGPVLVIAGAGSGKTRTLVFRVARLVEEGVRPERILLLTFTRKAANEMLRRAALILDERCEKVSGGTFHSFAAMILRKYAKFIGYGNNFTILDRSDSEDVINLIRSELGFNKKEIRFPKKSTLQDIFSKAVNKSTKLEKIIGEEYLQFEKNTPEIKKIFKRYEEYKKSKQVMDYDDLLLNLVKLLETAPKVREKLSEFYGYIMVDEYQDTNKLQARIIKLLAARHSNIMAVGDDSQSIYSFRGANFKNIMDFPKIFSGAKVITLEENYRSNQPILDLTNKIIDSAREKYSKKLFTAKRGGVKPVFLEPQSENLQSKFITQKVLELRESGVALDKIAVLFRSGWHSNDLEVELAAANIPFVKYGGFKFMETAHVKDVIAYLKVTANPKDAVSWLRILMLIDGIGPRKAEEIMKNLDAGETTTDEKGDGNIGQASLPEKYKEDVSRGLMRLQSLTKKLQAVNLSPEEQIEMVLQYYEPILRKKYDDYDKRQDDLNSLSSIAARYQSLEKFLTDITLEPPETSQSGYFPDSEEEEKLVLSTIHSAKGLEWHSVFLLSLIDGYLPSGKSLNSNETIEEERRLFYVAATRAKENLFLIKPQIDQPARSYFDESFLAFSRLTRFLDDPEILDELVEKWSLETEDDDGLELIPEADSFSSDDENIVYF